jgi:predicted enzyme related to lactoylglutathione lyase
LGNNSNYNKVGYIEIPTNNVEETKEFYSKMFGWEYEKSKEGGGESEEKYCLIKNAGIKGAITSKREHNQTPTFYIMVESIDDFIANLNNKAQR